MQLRRQKEDGMLWHWRCDVQEGRAQAAVPIFGYAGVVRAGERPRHGTAAGWCQGIQDLPVGLAGGEDSAYG